VDKRRYNDLCHSCSVKGEKSPRWKERITLICNFCKKEFKVIPNDKNRKRKFCCKTCYEKWNVKENHSNWKGGNITFICDWCKKEYKKLPSLKGRKFCCKECHNKWMIKYQTGESCPAWIDGRSFGKYCKLFNTQFKEKVRDFYNRRCFLCGKTQKDNSEKLSVHHVNHDKDCLCGSLCDFVPLCRICHTKITGKYIERYWEDIIMCYLYPERYFLINV
jgi:endogenous inhibitor of DNA gyrase (YacG/DUF329 family)